VTSVTDTATALDIGQRWADAWSAPTPEGFVDLYAEDGEYFDVTFGIRRRGRDLLGQHHSIWRSAVPDFVTTLVDAHAGEGLRRRRGDRPRDVHRLGPRRWNDEGQP